MILAIDTNAAPLHGLGNVVAACSFPLAAANPITPGLWHALGWTAQGLVAVAVIWLIASSRRGGRPETPVGMAAIGMVGAILGLAYALVVQEWVFVVGQALLFILFGRLMSKARTEQMKETPRESPRLPVVAPDSAEIKLRDLQAASGRQKSG